MMEGFGKFSLYYWLFLLLVYYPVLYLLYRRRQSNAPADDKMEYKGDIIVKKRVEISVPFG